MTTSASAGPSAGALRRIHDLPGPRGWPLLGNLPQIQRSQVHRHVEAWAHEFGPVFTFRLGRRRLGRKSRFRADRRAFGDTVQRFAEDLEVR